MSKLAVEDLSKDFGGVHAVRRVSFSLDPGIRLAIIGPNGAGKTTLLNLLTGQLRPSEGRILLDGADITAMDDFERARLDISRTFQHTNLYPGLTAVENVRIAVQRTMGLAHKLLPVPGYDSLRRECERVLARHGLEELRHARAQDLSYGDLRHLELVLALITDSSLMFLDEPTAGMTPEGTRRMIELIQGIPRTMTVCIVEHDMDVVFTLADRVIVLHRGEIIADDTPGVVKEDPMVRRVYLGDHAAPEP